MRDASDASEILPYLLPVRGLSKVRATANPATRGNIFNFPRSVRGTRKPARKNTEGFAGRQHVRRRRVLLGDVDASHGWLTWIERHWKACVAWRRCLDGRRSRRAAFTGRRLPPRAIPNFPKCAAFWHPLHSARPLRFRLVDSPVKHGSPCRSNRSASEGLPRSAPHTPRGGLPLGSGRAEARAMARGDLDAERRRRSMRFDDDGSSG